MFSNIIIFFIILIILTLILHYSNSYKEGFLDLPVKHDQFVKESQIKFNELTNTVNLTNPNVPLSSENTKAFEAALGGFSAHPSSDTFKLEANNDYSLPSNSPNALKIAKSCEIKGIECSAFDDPVFAANCGISFDINGIGSDGKPKIGGMFISSEDRKNQMDTAEHVKTSGIAPYDPFKVYKPTLGKSKPGAFALTKDQCLIVKERMDCETKQTFSSPNCSQCYTSQAFSRIDPKTGRNTSKLYLVGNGNITVTTPNASNDKKITLAQTKLTPEKSTVITIPENAEGTVFNIMLQPSDESQIYVAGVLQGTTPLGTFKFDLLNMVQSDLITNSKPKISGNISVEGFKGIAMIPGTGQTTMNLSCLMPFTFINVFDSDALTCDNGPLITHEASATFLDSDPCFGKDNKPGNYKLECLQARWLALGGTQQGTGFPNSKAKADAIQIDGNGNGLSINTIVDNLSNKMKQAISGTDQNGNVLNVNDWNNLSTWATGKVINTPCDGPNSINGPLSKECLSYLYLNQGVSSHIGPTYTLTPGQMASMKGQNFPNTYCQPGTSIDPTTDDGLKFGQKLGGINSVKQTYDQINRLANDNSKPNAQRADAIKQCYGVTIDSMEPLNTRR